MYRSDGRPDMGTPDILPRKVTVELKPKPTDMKAAEEKEATVAHS